MKKAKLLWIDLEMTGLVPGKDKILEVAAIATGWDLEPLDEMTAVVKVPEKLMKERMVGEFWEKNAKSRDGLMEQNKTGLPSRKVEELLLEFIDKNFGKTGKVPGKECGSVILAGNSIHQDKKFIEIEWPEVNKKLHYRMLDVSAWKVYFEGARGEKFVKREAHRALDDIKGSMEELEWYLKLIK